ncbi:uncharacterized protein LOC117610302 isoform X2 [Osmia lignaria lignaria]|uniref:uncharacterized protein LOC117610302 isoform X2 n=1 Tax=Osmia lignaria lignaria TaxID=1437193 RepID=UPI001478BADA|nr:uncharacterized protein LOC117610302 isoform X2 [Osmia lignaria]
MKLINKPLIVNYSAFLEGDTCKFGKSSGKSLTSCDFCKCLDDKLKITGENSLNQNSSGLCKHLAEIYNETTDENISNQKSGDWNREEEIIEHHSEPVIEKPSIHNWKWKNPYSFSNFNRRSRNRFIQEKKFSTTSTRDGCNKVDRKGTNFLHNFREYLVNYQESCGVPRTEYSFSALIQIMGQATGRSLLALLYVMLNILPLAEILLYVLRFVLDKVINIGSSRDFRQTILRCFVFTTELLSIYICLIFIFGFIVLPILQTVIGIVAKIMLYN